VVIHLCRADASEGTEVANVLGIVNGAHVAVGPIDIISSAWPRSRSSTWLHCDVHHQDEHHIADEAGPMHMKQSTRRGLARPDTSFVVLPDSEEGGIARSLVGDGGGKDAAPVDASMSDLSGKRCPPSATVGPPAPASTSASASAFASIARIDKTSLVASIESREVTYGESEEHMT